MTVLQWVFSVTWVMLLIYDMAVTWQLHDERKMHNESILDHHVSCQRMMDKLSPLADVGSSAVKWYELRMKAKMDDDLHHHPEEVKAWIKAGDDLENALRTYTEQRSEA